MTALTADVLSELQQALLELRDELAQRWHDLEQAAAPVQPSEALGRLTRLEAMQDQAQVVARRKSIEARRSRVQRALRAIEAGDDYGLCVRCEEEIPLARLRAMPDVLTCVPCQDGDAA